MPIAHGGVKQAPLSCLKNAFNFFLTQRKRPREYLGRLYPWMVWAPLGQKGERLCLFPRLGQLVGDLR